jgi:hypothetical protein
MHRKIVLSNAELLTYLLVGRVGGGGAPAARTSRQTGPARSPPTRAHGARELLPRDAAPDPAGRCTRRPSRPRWSCTSYPC